MATLSLPSFNRPSAVLPLRRWPAEFMSRERRLTLYAALLLALLLPMALAWGVDERVLRGANVWIKPMKFALSIAVLALTVTWFVGHLPVARRGSRAVSWIVRLLIGAGSFELGYITLQAALGQASHYNQGDALHSVMYALMGLGAIVLTATQPLLAWQLHRHGDQRRPAVYRHAVIVGLTLSFVLGGGAGALLSNLQPPSGGASLPLLGWALGGGDLRPAHFVGLHAAQLLPLIGWAGAAWAPKHARVWLWTAVLAYTALFAGLMASGLYGRL